MAARPGQYAGLPLSTLATAAGHCAQPNCGHGKAAHSRRHRCYATGCTCDGWTPRWTGEEAEA